jgi:hypothetical protein
MRTTIEIPDALFRRTKSLAATRGISLKQLIVSAVEREVDPVKPVAARAKRPQLPVIHLELGREFDLTSFNFDDLLS